MSATPLPATSQVRGTITLLALAGFFSAAGLRMCDGMLPRLAADFGITTGQAGRVMLSFMAAYGLAQLAYGPFGDRYGKVRMMCIALFGAAAGSLACAFAPGFDTLVALRIVWGMAAAGVIPLSMAWVGDAVPYGQRQALLARLMLGALSGMLAGQVVGGMFADSAAGWRGAFVLICACYALIGSLLLARLRHISALSPVTGEALAFGAQLAAVLRVPWARVVLLVALLEGMFMMGPTAFLPSYLYQRFNVSLTTASALLALYAVGGLAYSATARHIVARLGERRMVLFGSGLVALGFIGWLVMPAAWLAAPIAMVVGFGTFLFHNTMQTHATQMAPAARGSAVALFAFGLFTGQAIGVAWVGFAFDHFGPAPLLLLPALMMPLTGWGFVQAMRRRPAS